MNFEHQILMQLTRIADSLEKLAACTDKGCIQNAVAITRCDYPVSVTTDEGDYILVKDIT